MSLNQLFLGDIDPFDHHLSILLQNSPAPLHSRLILNQLQCYNALTRKHTLSHGRYNWETKKTIYICKTKMDISLEVSKVWLEQKQKNLILSNQI